MHPVKNRGNKDVYFIARFTYSLHSEAHFSFYEFKIFVHSNDSICGGNCTSKRLVPGGKSGLTDMVCYKRLLYMVGFLDLENHRNDVLHMKI